MTYGRIINEIEYICLQNDNRFKKLSLEDNVYFTLRDIFLNGDSCDLIMEANSFNQRLTNGISYEDRTEYFAYTNVLDDSKYLSQLSHWLKHFSEYYFDFVEPESDEEIDMNEYITFNDWWFQFEELRKDLELKQKN